MKTIKIPYYTSTMDLHVEEENCKAVIYSGTDEYQAKGTEKELVEEALANPIGSPRLRELAKGKNKVVLVTSDHTRAVPSKLTLPILLKEIREGNPDADITILIATGLHRPTTEEEQRRMFGDEIVDHEKIVVNKAFEKDDFEFVCGLPSGAELWVNKVALHCDLLIAEGFIEPHFFAGFSGGRKSILPGICNAATVNENHSYKAIASPYSTTGVLEHNPIHEDMVYAARAVNLQFIMNVALNSEKKVIAAFAGDLEEAHEKGVAFVRSLAQCPGITGDIVVTSNGGYPLDQNLYQSPKAVATAEACCKDGGVIIMCCSCCDGMGGSNFEKLIVKGTVDEIDAFLSKIPPKESISEQWCAQIYSRILKKHKVILVTTYLDHELVRKANMIPASSPDEALAMAYEMMGKDAKVVVIPDGVAVLAVKED
ncbi:MAG: nickel-dependent lactate racemase [Lachnospiraceae bacterium]|nr:nickel-dependent lactate racemase [Lachnospiraceae bacterium]